MDIWNTYLAILIASLLTIICYGIAALWKEWNLKEVVLGIIGITSWTLGVVITCQVYYLQWTASDNSKNDFIPLYIIGIVMIFIGLVMFIRSVIRTK